MIRIHNIMSQQSYKKDNNIEIAIASQPLIQYDAFV